MIGDISRDILRDLFCQTVQQYCRTFRFYLQSQSDNCLLECRHILNLPIELRIKLLLRKIEPLTLQHLPAYFV